MTSATAQNQGQYGWLWCIRDLKLRRWLKVCLPTGPVWVWDMREACLFENEERAAFYRDDWLGAYPCRVEAIWVPAPRSDTGEKGENEHGDQ